ncbi:YbaL family putative K(+) efflux transporter [Niveispirillum sp. BGYR6]|uniref:YbaL family putative K(+) efflux transporter n=1 Tax=Niveispirillum sp. BGYR6 TaxID=2971249 RepID=UPI0022B997C9|nr:YbaL family putative K(+) efflux transporter [Niveispirillum sp. BGYR6]MDG5495327.1 YbaL family putative K(+) efflux transporter [Niveispirillum sp. BGYR6]
MHHAPLITMIVAGLALAFIFGMLAQRLKISPLVGYLVAGVLIGPGTPGYVADTTLAPQLAEIGVILLMFGVGLHFSLKDLMSVKAIAIPGAVAQIGVATLMGMALAWVLGWTLGAGLVFGLALSVASTVVLLRALQERRLVETHRGRIAVGWLIVEDLAMVLALVLLPALAGLLGDGSNAAPATVAAQAGGQSLGMVILITLAKVAAFVALMLVVGRRVIPWILHEVAHSGSRELFRLAVLAIALGVAFGAAELFGVSFALGAFFAGMVLSGSPLSHRAAEESLPLRDAFAVLFFVSVGMMFDPAILVKQPLQVLATLLIILVGKSVVAYLIVLAFGHPRRTALTIAASLAQIGEFSFILAALGVSLGMLPPEGQDLVLVGAILSILVNPLLFTLIDKYGHRLDPALAEGEKAGEPPAAATRELPTPTSLTDHAIIIGYGRVGSLIGQRLGQDGIPFLTVEDNADRVDALRKEGVEVITGNAVLADVLAAANVAGARLMFVAIPNAFEAGQIIRQARTANADLRIIARAHADAEVEHLQQNGASHVVMGERETARGMIEEGLGREEPAPAALPLASIPA